jgi:hypothetical protein
MTRDPIDPDFPGTVLVLFGFQELCPSVPQNAAGDFKCPSFPGKENT